MKRYGVQARPRAQDQFETPHQEAYDLAEEVNQGRSDYCHDAADTTKISCNCHHAECETGTAAAAASEADLHSAREVERCVHAGRYWQ